MDIFHKWKTLKKTIVVLNLWRRGKWKHKKPPKDQLKSDLNSLTEKISWSEYMKFHSLRIFHIYGYIANSRSDQLPVGLTAQLIEHCTGIAADMGWNLVQAWICFQVLFRQLLKLSA